MSESHNLPVLAVDGGGTRCRFAFSDGVHTHVVEGGPANAFSDFDGTVACLRSGLKALSDRAGVRVAALYACPAFVGLAGVTGSEVAGRLEQALPLKNARYGDDRLSALRGAFGASDGVLAHCGTGSFLGAQTGGTARLAGGWGSTLGDEASAFWVGRAALSVALRMADGMAPDTGLPRTILTRFDGPDGILMFMQTATPEAVGALAPEVTKAASNDDSAARRIMQAGADYIAEGSAKLGWAPGQRLCLTGGIGPCFAPYLSEPMRADLSEPDHSPLEGAIALARDQHEEAAHGHR